MTLLPTSTLRLSWPSRLDNFVRQKAAKIVRQNFLAGEFLQPRVLLAFSKNPTSQNRVETVDYPHETGLKPTPNRGISAHSAQIQVAV
jgi:hypothetical protein